MVIIHATKYDNEPIHMIHITKVKGNQFFNLGRSQSGIVSMNRKWMGHNTNHIIFRKQLFSFGNRINEYPLGMISTSAISFGWLSGGTLITSAFGSLDDFDNSASTTSSAPNLLTTFLFKSATVSSFVLASMWAMFFMFPFCWKCSIVSEGTFSDRNKNKKKWNNWIVNYQVGFFTKYLHLWCLSSIRDYLFVIDGYVHVGHLLQNGFIATVVSV